MALGTPEHSGKVHGVGAYVTPITYFHMPVMTVNERAFKQLQFYIEQHKKDEECYNRMEAEYKRIIQELQRGKTSPYQGSSAFPQPLNQTSNQEVHMFKPMNPSHTHIVKVNAMIRIHKSISLFLTL